MSAVSKRAVEAKALLEKCVLHLKTHHRSSAAWHNDGPTFDLVHEIEAALPHLQGAGVPGREEIARALEKAILDERLFSDAMDCAVAAYQGARYAVQKNAVRANEKVEGEDLHRASLRAAFAAYLQEHPNALTDAVLALLASSAQAGGEREGRAVDSISWEMVTAFMREFEKWSPLLRYKEADGWHTVDRLGVRHALAAALSSAPAQEWREPEGWRFVPVEPNDETIRRLTHDFSGWSGTRLDAGRRRYQELLNAAPLPPAPREEGVGG